MAQRTPTMRFSTPRVPYALSRGRQQRLHDECDEAPDDDLCGEVAERRRLQ